MSDRLVPGVTVSILRYSTGRIGATVSYYLDSDDVIMARTGELTLTDLPGTTGSKEWAVAALKALLQAL